MVNRFRSLAFFKIGVVPIAIGEVVGVVAATLGIVETAAPGTAEATRLLVVDAGVTAAGTMDDVEWKGLLWLFVDETKGIC